MNITESLQEVIKNNKGTFDKDRMAQYEKAIKFNDKLIEKGLTKPRGYMLYSACNNFDIKNNLDIKKDNK